MHSISVCFSPALYPHYADNDSIAVVVDIFRASTSICAAFQNGVKSIKTIANIDEAIEYKRKGYLVAAERNTHKCDFADFGNSPFGFTPEKINGKELIFTTTNGTKAVETAKNALEIIIGAFSNISAVADFCIKKEKNILIICSGWNDRFCLEDTLFAGALSKKLTDAGKFSYKSDATRAAMDLWNIAQNNLFQYICTSEHYARLQKNGLEREVEYCLEQNTVSLVPIWDKNLEAFINNDKKIFTNKLNR